MTPITLESSAKTWWEANNKNLAQELYERGEACWYGEEPQGFWEATVSPDVCYELTVQGQTDDGEEFEFTVSLVTYTDAWLAYAAWKEYTDAGKWLGVSK